MEGVELLTQSDTDVADVLELFTSKGITATFLVPTKTGIEKSIMDATSPVRNFFLEAGVHNYDEQPQGPENKRIVEAYLVNEDGLEKTKVSLYRPVTKSGDPRIWIYGLKGFANANNLLALIYKENCLYIVNCSNSEVLSALDNPKSAAYVLVETAWKLSANAEYLLERLREIGSLGPIPTIKTGATGVGMTLEHWLDIAPNATKSGGDYRGIELKAHRKTFGSQKTRSTLFSQVPNWKRSYVRNGKELLDKCGYVRDGVLRLYCTMSAQAPNPQGLELFIHQYDDDLWSRMHREEYVEPVNVWELGLLRSRLLEKHKETFWVRANVSNENDSEHFHYVQAKYTRSPIVNNFDALLEAGRITLDYTIKLKPDGRTRDHGYLFKIQREDLGALFPEPVVLDLI